MDGYYGSHHDQLTEMYHYGTVGMRWGVRKRYIPKNLQPMAKKTTVQKPVAPVTQSARLAANKKKAKALMNAKASKARLEAKNKKLRERAKKKVAARALKAQKDRIKARKKVDRARAKLIREKVRAANKARREQEAAKKLAIREANKKAAAAEKARLAARFTSNGRLKLKANSMAKPASASAGAREAFIAKANKRKKRR